MTTTAAHYDERKLYLAAMEEVTAGDCVPYLNNADDLHKANVHLMTSEEVSEALQALSAAPITKRKDQLLDSDKQAIKAAIMESIEAITVLTHYVAVLCKEYMFSWSCMWKLHRQELHWKQYQN
ncbi:XRE family transcriptional regulator [Paenibacillus chartarius]|uniref:XRE family transcriptional regulator n=1 Tax=Paenibacillus chartarius TaxID=747481 RepID=A0ABV6DN27_9BACL